MAIRWGRDGWEKFVALVMVCVSLVLQLIGLLARVSAVPPLDAPVAR
eukprot:COSAG05_NODE_20370_length_280_cov_0.574586_1_plen_46_part_01